jgi:hypothetical protein
VRGMGGTTGHGVVGQAEGSLKAGLYGYSTHADGLGVFAWNNNAGKALYVNGKVDVLGAMTISNSYAGSTAAPAIHATASNASYPAIKATSSGAGNAIEAVGPITTTTTVTATTFIGNVSGNLTGGVTGNVTGNISGSSGSCTGNAATATTAAACSGNAATATTAAACSGNSATATTAGDVTNAGGAKLICGTYNTNMQTDGNLVVYHGATPYWDATTDLSDGKFKEAIVPTKHAGLDVINGLRVVDYKWKQDIPVTIKNKDKLKTGFIAQEVQALVPDAVNDIDGTLLLHKEELVPYLVKAVQELSEQVKAMQIEIQALKSK